MCKLLGPVRVRLSIHDDDDDDDDDDNDDDCLKEVLRAGRSLP